jgi:hypothetical protein
MGPAMQASITRSGGKTLLKFSKPLDAQFTGTGSQNFIAAVGAAGPLSTHTAYESFSVNLATGSASVVKDDRRKWQRLHAWLMGLGWGVSIPLGIASALALRSCGPVWCAP